VSVTRSPTTGPVVYLRERSLEIFQPSALLSLI
jgi:hypothetical protein